MATSEHTEPNRPDADHLREAVAVSDLIPLLVALALRLDDDSFIDPRFAPDLVSYALGIRPNGGLENELLEEARELAVQGLLRASADEASEMAAPDEAALRKILAFLTGDESEDYLSLVRRELSLNGDVESGEKLAEAVQQQPADQQVLSKVAIIGTGISGLLAAIRLTQAGVPFTVFEKNAGIGGTWYENRYPGARLDTSNFGYSFSFKQHNWKNYYSTQGEIEEYLNAVAEDFDLRANIRFSTEVESLEWDGAAWQVTAVSNGERTVESFSHVITATGQLNRPKIPNFPGLGKFRGEYWHSAQWPADAELSGKRVAVVGTGASAFQIVSALQPEVAELSVFQRSAPWMLPTPGYSSALPSGFSEILEMLPEYGRVLRFYQFWIGLEGRRRFAVVDPEWTSELSVSELNEQFRQALIDSVQEQFKDRPDLLERAIPNYPPTGKRILRDDNKWAAALQQPNVSLVTDGIESFTERGIRTADGVEHEFDAVVFCTGFHADRFLSPMQIRGTDGRDLDDAWPEDAEALLGMHIAGFPNLVMLYGPNTNLVVNGSVVFLVECAINRVVEILEHQLELGARTFDVTEETVQQFTEDLDRANRGMAWGDSRTQTWYKGASGRVVSVWPYSMLHYWQATHNVDFSKLVFA